MELGPVLEVNSQKRETLFNMSLAKMVSFLLIVRAFSALAQLNPNYTGRGSMRG